MADDGLADTVFSVMMTDGDWCDGQEQSVAVGTVRPVEEKRLFWMGDGGTNVAPLETLNEVALRSSNRACSFQSNLRRVGVGRKTVNG